MKQNLSFIKQQANQWLVKLETDSMADGDEERFVEWMEQDERHGQAFYQAEQTWKLMAEAGASNAKEALISPTSSIQTKSWSVNALISLAASILVVFASVFWWQDIYFATMSDHYTHTGQRLEQKLSDGSELVLNTDTAIDVQYDDNTRLVKVLSGEVYVTVAKDPNRPFVVQIGDLQVTALGTQFIVKKERNSDPSVTVTEHSVKVESTASNKVNLVLNQGYKVSLDETNETLSKVESVNTELAQSWRTGKYVFNDQPLELVIAELNRYYEGKILIRDNTLVNKRVTGVLDLDNPRVSLNNLAKSLGVEVNSMTPYVLLLEKS